MPAYNKLAALKDIGAIKYRLNTASPVSRICIDRCLENLIDTLPEKFHGIVTRIYEANKAKDDLELVAGLALLESMIPLTYGLIPAGTSFHVPGGGVQITKRKEGIEFGRFKAGHLAADQRVVPV